MADSESIENLDRCDPLAPLRGEFALRDGLIYLDGNSLGPPPRTAAQRIARMVDVEWKDGLITSWLAADWSSSPRRVGDKIAPLIGAAPGEVIAADSTSINLFKCMAAALSLRPGRRAILSEAGNFPTDLYMMQGLENFTDGRIAARIVAADQVLESLDDDVAAVVLTQVHYKSASIRDLAAVTRRVHDAGALMIWDLSHSAGSIPVDLNAAGADFATGCGYKFLNGGPGAPAFMFVAARHQGQSQAVLSGWFGHRDPFAFTDDYQPAADIQRFLCGTPTVLGLIALECGVEVFHQTDMQALRRKAQRLGRLFIDLMSERCSGYGFDLASPDDDELRGGHVSFRHPHGYEIMQALKANDVIGDFRAPDILRFGVTPLYLRYMDISNAVDIIHDTMAKSLWDRDAYRIRTGFT
ncbi:MAG: kynureninase [Steroidobacteraceae bacterium]